MFGDLMIPADHKILSEESESRNNHRYAVVVQDLATQWLQFYSCKTKTSQETEKSVQKFSTRKPKVIHTDTSLESGKSCEELSWNHCTSTPHRSETNGIAERAVRRVKEGTSAVLLQSGLDKDWWMDSVECCCCLRNIQDLLSDGKKPYERRFGMVLSMEELCEDHGYTYNWFSVQTPHLIRNGKRIDCKKSNYVPFVVPGLSASSSSTTPSPTFPSSSSQDSVI